GGRGEATKEIWYYEHRLPEGQKSYSKTKPIRREEFQPIEDWWKKRKATDQAWKVDIKTIRERGFDLDIKNPTRATEEETHSSAELLGMLGESFEKSLGLLRELEAEL
ncbi:MAG: N-6 DNA methylase, partial [Saprospiraceae bacterium]